MRASHARDPGSIPGRCTLPFFCHKKSFRIQLLLAQSLIFFENYRELFNFDFQYVLRQQFYLKFTYKRNKKTMTFFPVSA